MKTLILNDTNVLIPSVEVGSASHEEALAAQATLSSQGNQLCIVPQNLYEIWVVATRPRVNNGFGLDPSPAADLLGNIERSFRFFADNAFVCEEWRRLVLAHRVRGKPSHDARLVAAMRVHGIRKLLTYNTGDFARYPGLELLHPSQVIQAARQT